MIEILSKGHTLPRPQKALDSWNVTHSTEIDMELEMVRGCVCDSLTVDGEQEINLTDEKRKEVLKALGEYITNLPPSELNNLMQLLLDYYGEYEDLGHCDCCGDWIDKNTLKL